MSSRSSLVEVSGLSVEFPFGNRWTPMVRDASFSIAPDEAVGLVGESGSGKSVTAMAMLGLIPELGGRVSKGSIHVDGTDVLSASAARLRQLRGDRIGMIFQQPGRSLNPAFTVGDHIAETVRCHRRVSRADAWQRAVALLDRVGIASAAKRASDYPHQFSGGMCQRVMIAIAICCDPAVLIADEPTTALDVTVQAKVLELLRDLRRDLGMAMLFISHDLAVVSEVCERVVVMYAGETVESGPAEELFSSPRHPYTAGLLAAIPDSGPRRRLALIEGSIPSPAATISGCRFHPRCREFIKGLCDTVPSVSRYEPGGRMSRCTRSEARIST